jgi:hypothetical protein
MAKKTEVKKRVATKPKAKAKTSVVKKEKVKKTVTPKSHGISQKRFGTISFSNS